MKMTPLDIKKQDFSKSLRGYDPEEVDAFLSMLANQWELLQDEKRRAEERSRDLKNKIEHYENVEEALQEALQTARENKEQILDNARREAKVIVREAKSEADSIKGDAEDRHKHLKREVSQLSDRRGEIVARLRAFLMSEMELLARFDGEDPSGFIKLVPGEGQKQLRNVSSSEGKQKETATSEESPRADRKQEINASSESDTETVDSPEQKRPPEEGGEAEVHDFVSQVSTRQEESASRSHPDTENKGHVKAQESSDAEEKPRDNAAGAEASLTPASAEEKPAEVSGNQDSPGWIVHSLFNADEEASSEAVPAQRPQHDEEVREEEEDVTASSEEIEKIRRILSDMDD